MDATETQTTPPTETAQTDDDANTDSGTSPPPALAEGPSIHPGPDETNGGMEDPEAHQYRIAVERNAEDLDRLPEGLHPYLVHDGKLIRLDGKALKKKGLPFSKLLARTVLTPESDPALLQEAGEFICTTEWLGTLAQQTTHIFSWRLRPELDPAETLVAVLTFSCPGAFSTTLFDDAARVEKLVSRGACISWAPKHLPSHMLSDAIDWMVAQTEARCFVAYGDPAAGERGKVYTGANWRYLGPDHGAEVEWFHPSISREKGWLTDRDLRHVWTYKLYAQRAGVEWDDSWVEGQALRWDNVSPHDHRRLKEEEAKFKNECHPLPQALKHKFCFVKGRTPAEDKALWETLIRRRPDLIALKKPPTDSDGGWMDGQDKEEEVHEPCFANHIMRFVYREGGQIPVWKIRENGGLPKVNRKAASLRPCLAHLVREGYLLVVKFNRTEVSVVERGAVPFLFTTPEREQEADALRMVVRRSRLRLEAEFLIDRALASARRAREHREVLKGQRYEDEARALIVALFPDGIPQDFRALFDPPSEAPGTLAVTEESKEMPSFDMEPEQPFGVKSDASPSGGKRVTWQSQTRPLPNGHDVRSETITTGPGNG